MVTKFKLRKIFESHDFDHMNQVRIKYFADKLKSEFLISESMIVNINDKKNKKIENEIFNEAIKYGSEQESLTFIRNIENEIRMDESFVDGAKKAFNWVKDKLKKAAGRRICGFFIWAKVFSCLIDKVISG